MIFFHIFVIVARTVGAACTGWYMLLAQPYQRQRNRRGTSISDDFGSCRSSSWKQFSSKVVSFSMDVHERELSRSLKLAVAATAIPVPPVPDASSSGH